MYSCQFLPGFCFVSVTSGLSKDAVVTAEDVATMSPEQARSVGGCFFFWPDMRFVSESLKHTNK